LSQLGAVSSRKVRELSSQIADDVNLHPKNTDGLVRQLSGGNQQKIAFGRWLATSPKLLVLDEPSAGVDVGAKAEIHQLINTLTHKGTSVLLVSSDLEELLLLSDRIMVLRDGFSVGELSADEATESKIVSLGTQEIHESIEKVDSNA